MIKKSKKGMRKALPVGLAMGVLFSSIPLAAPLTEHKVHADVDTAATIITTFGDIYNKFLSESFGKWLDERSAKRLYNFGLENSAYIAPTFQKGEFGISVFDYYKNQNFSKKIKIAYPNGKTEYKTIKHGEQIRIKQAGTIVDLTPDEPELNKRNLLYITQKQLDEGKTGVALTNWQTFYLESNNEGRYTNLADRFVQQEFPGAYTPAGVLDARYNIRDLFNKLPEDKRRLGTATSEPVGKEVLSNYTTNDPEALADFNNRLSTVLVDNLNGALETVIQLKTIPSIQLNDGNPYQIIPYKKGTNKVFVKKGSKYLSGKEGSQLQYSDSISDDELFELVQTNNDNDGKFQFHLVNKNGVKLAGNSYVHGFETNWSYKSEISFPEKSNNEIQNWLKNWYPGKENEKQKYDGIQIVADEKDSTKLIAKDSSGNVIKNSWINRGSDYHFADADGVLLTGWHELEGKTYYFHPSSTHLINTSGYEIDGKYYNFNDDGALQRSSWKDDGYSDASGAFVKEGPQEADGKIYRFKDYNVNKKEIRLEAQNRIIHVSDKGAFERVSDLDGKVLGHPGMLWLDEKQIAFAKDGSIINPGISKVMERTIDGNEEAVLKYYSLEEGTGYTGWKMKDGKKYHFSNGSHYTFNDYENIDGKKYYFHEDGSANKAGFEKIDGKLYHFDNNGVAQKGWQTIDNKYYYFDENGAAKTGRFGVNGGYRPMPLGYGYLFYYAREDGSLYTDGWFKIDGVNYHFDKWGHEMPY
ncbi:cell wall-binding protein [Bacillus paramycoides]|uniref:N-acetylmuramoyl-L-alanine amidase family protein n=1 Tax=Bacillus paramycoides TaxID=2026194 RepID=UPI0015BAA9FF|nr:cell wall-binding protein [Bacillus paramycoides]NWK72587.1 cell wall-binding protein [Bacillus paramycoides]